ncbi:MAG: peptide chain release factor N(5)-glutamine methyltransferase [Anaerolineae bacterium]
MAGPSPADACPQRLTDALRWAIRLFVLRQADSPRLDAELLLAHVMHVQRPWLLVHGNDCLSTGQARQFSALVHRALDDEPIAYLTGERPFYDVTLHVSPAVLIPRPETEHIVEEALAWASRQKPGLRVVDVGTGSGALAIVLARHLPFAMVIGTDLSSEALRVAAQNVQRHDLGARVHLLQADLLSALGGRFDLVVANLPYIDPLELPTLQPGVRDHEPRMALDGGPSGTAVILRLIAELRAYLARPGLSLLECDPREAGTLLSAAREALPDARVDMVKDLAGLDRVVRIERSAL